MTDGNWYRDTAAALDRLTDPLPDTATLLAGGERDVAANAAVLRDAAGALRWLAKTWDSGVNVDSIAHSLWSLVGHENVGDALSPSALAVAAYTGADATDAVRLISGVWDGLA